MPMTADEMIRLLQQNGFQQIRTCGSHRTFRNETTKRQTTVPYHRKELPKGTEQKILKEAGLK